MLDKYVSELGRFYLHIVYNSQQLRGVFLWFLLAVVVRSVGTVQRMLCLFRYF